MKRLFERLTAPTPTFFRGLRNVAIAVGLIATAVATAGISVPAIATIGTIAATVATASQLAVKNDE